MSDILKGNEGKAYAKANLKQIKIDDVNWKVLHINPETGQYWKEWFPQSHLQGGGPPEFVKITADQAKAEFDIL